MDIQKKLRRTITKFLNNQENSEERKELYTWYDSLDNSDNVTDQETKKIQAKAKERILKQIEPKKASKKIWYTIASTAAALVLVGYFIFFNKDSTNEALIDPIELASILPSENSATITTSAGEIIHLDTLSTNTTIQIGNSLVTKDENGLLTYSNIVSPSYPNDYNRINTMTTPKKGQYIVMLSDGTRVYLNSSSSLKYPEKFGPEQDRIVELTGEAYFEVTKTGNNNRFIVKTLTQDIQVLGTKFNVNAYETNKNTLTTLAEGSVRVQPTNTTLNPVTLKPNQQAIVGDQMRVKLVNSQDIIAWTQGYFAFDENNIEEILQQVARWYDIQIEYHPRKQSPVEYSGKIPKNINLAKLVELFNYADINVKATKINGQYKLTIY